MVSTSETRHSCCPSPLLANDGGRRENCRLLWKGTPSNIIIDHHNHHHPNKRTSRCLLANKRNVKLGYFSILLLSLLQSVSKFDVYFHRKEFRRKKGWATCPCGWSSADGNNCPRYQVYINCSLWRKADQLDLLLKFKLLFCFLHTLHPLPTSLVSISACASSPLAIVPTPLTSILFYLLCVDPLFVIEHWNWYLTSSIS